MTFQIAKIAIQRAFSELSPGKRLKIEFRGGEPFLEFHFIKKVCDWVIKEYPADTFSFYAITNGTCFSDEAKQWLQANKEIFTTPLSIDGGRSTQNRNRSNSFDLIDFDFLFRTWPRPCCITTILPENAVTVFQDLQFLMDKGFDVRANFEFTKEWTAAQLDELARGLKRFADYVLEKQHTNRINLLSRNSILDYSIVQDENESIKRKHLLVCNAGKYRHLVDANGNVYPCQAFVPSAFNWSLNSTNEDMFKKLKTEVLHPAKCRTCNFFYVCHLCPGFSYGYAGNFKWRNPSLCTIIKMRTFLASYYWGKQIQGCTNKMSMNADDMRQTMAAITELYQGEKIYA